MTDNNMRRNIYSKTDLVILRTLFLSSFFTTYGFGRDLTDSFKGDYFDGKYNKYDFDDFLGKVLEDDLWDDIFIGSVYRLYDIIFKQCKLYQLKK